MKKALIFEGKLIQIESESFPVVPTMIWIDVEDDVTMETHTYDGVNIVTISKLTTEQKRALLAPLSAWQIRKVLTQSGLRVQVEDAVLNADQNTQDAWHYATSFKRDDAILNGMAVQLGISDVQLDSMFELGVTL